MIDASAFHKPRGDSDASLMGTYSTTLHVPNTVILMTPKGDPKYTFHFLRKMFATGLARGGAGPARIQSMCRWLSQEAADLHDQLSDKDHVALADSAYVHCSTIITPTMLKNLSLPQLDDNDILQAWGKHLQIDLTAVPILDWM